MDVKADLEAIVIVIGVMVAAPVPVRLHPVDVVVDRPAALAKPGSVAIDSCAIVLEPLPTIVAPVMVGKCGCANRKSEPHRQCRSQN
jgi:hypothetical protein